MNPHDVQLLFMAFISEILGTLSGFGSSTFFVPLAQLIESFQLVLAITSILHCFGNFSKMILFREFMAKDLIWKYAVPSIILTAVGAFFSDQMSNVWLHKLLGAVLVIVSAITLLRESAQKNIPPKIALLIMSASGFLTGFVGTGGALRGVALSTLHLQKESFIFLSSAIDIGGDLLRTGIYLEKGFMPKDHWFYIPLLGVAALSGSFLGKKIVMRINQKMFEKIVAVFILISGISMLLT